MDFRIDGLHGRKDRNPHVRHIQRSRKINRILHNVDLVLQRRRNVNRGVGDNQRIRMARHVHDEAMADAARRAYAPFARHHCSHYLVRMEAALHQSLGFAITRKLDGFCCGIVTVQRVHDS